LLQSFITEVIIGIGDERFFKVFSNFDVSIACDFFVNATTAIKHMIAMVLVFESHHNFCYHHCKSDI
jgi:hypothetical protein